MSEKSVKVATPDGTVVEMENGIITTPDGTSILIEESMISISQGGVCKDCGHPLTYTATINPGMPVKRGTYCAKCDPKEGD